MSDKRAGDDEHDEHDEHDEQRTGTHAAPAHSVTCPFCGSRETELLSLFGSQLSTTQYYCRTCRTPFEHMKQDADAES
ncbi:MAG: hypothetical protein ACHQ4H_13790 [Ktedonobacterales bacterium]